MSIEPLLTLVSFVLFTGAVAVGTWLLTRRKLADNSTGYFLAGRSLTAGYIAGSLLLTNLSTEQLVGLNGAAFKDGLSVMAWEVIAGASLVVMALFFLPRYLRSGIATVPQFLAERYAASTQTITTVIFLIAYAAILLPMILYTGALGMNGILDMPKLTGINNPSALLWLMVWVIGVIGTIYAVFGGLRAVAVSDTLNGFGLLVGGLLITFLGLKAVSPNGVFAALDTLRESHPEKFNSLGGPDQSVPFSTLFTGVLLLNLFYWCTNQQIIQRAFAATSLAQGQKGVLLAGFFKVLAPVILVLPGIIAFHLYAGEGLKPDAAYGRLVRSVLPWWLSGFFAAVMAGAILSSFNSVLNSSATLFSLGIYKPFLRPGASDHEVVRSGMVFGIVAALASMTAAPFLAGQESIFAYLQKMNGLYFIPIFSVVLVGMLSRRVPTAAANTALVLGVLTIAAGYVLPMAVPAPQAADMGEASGEAAGFGEPLDEPAPKNDRAPVQAAPAPLAAVSGWLTRIGEFHFLGIVFAVLVALMLVWGAVAPRAVPWEQSRTVEVDLTPWRWAFPAGLGMVAVVVAIYLTFADPSAVRKPNPAAAAATDDAR